MIVTIFFILFVLLGWIGWTFAVKPRANLDSFPTKWSVVKAYSHAICMSIARIPKLKGKNISVTIPYQIDQAHLYTYKSLCSYTNVSDITFLTYFQSIATKAQIAIFAHPDFPFNLLGAVNTKTSMILHRVPKPEDALTVTCSLKNDDTKITRKGYEFDVICKIFGGKGNSTLIWESTFSVLAFAKTKSDARSSYIEDEIKVMGQIGEKSFQVPQGIGREYASLCNDYNPIHISSIAAKAFGFKSTIAHGMWVVGKIMATSMSHFMEFQNMFEHLEENKYMVLEVYFKRPVTLGEKLKFVLERRGVLGGHGVQFSAISEKSEQKAIVGSVYVKKK